jgi:hypothetical protein
VKVKCFGCDALLESSDCDGVASALVAHGRETHGWQYPEEAIRNYACNYAEATERLTGGTERLTEITNVTVLLVTEDSVDDWLGFFDMGQRVAALRLRLISTCGSRRSHGAQCDWRVVLRRCAAVSTAPSSVGSARPRYRRCIRPRCVVHRRVPAQ